MAKEHSAIVTAGTSRTICGGRARPSAASPCHPVPAVEDTATLAGRGLMGHPVPPDRGDRSSALHMSLGQRPVAGSLLAPSYGAFPTQRASNVGTPGSGRPGDRPAQANTVKVWPARATTCSIGRVTGIPSTTTVTDPPMVTLAEPVKT